MEQGFHIIDYAVFILVLLISFAIGIYQAFWNKPSTTKEYLSAGRTLRIVPTAVSLLISYISAVSILGNAAETYFYGIGFIFIVIGYIGGAVMIAITFVPLLHPLGITSVNEYLLLRFRSKFVVYFSSIIQIISFTLISGIILYGPALMLQSMAGISLFVSIPGLGLIAAVYTSIGGLRAVIWSDVFQCIVIFGSLFAIVIVGTFKVGGVHEVFSIYAASGRLDLEFSPMARSSVIGLTIGMATCFFGMFGSSQIAVQRITALPTLEAAQKAMLITIPVNTAIQSLTCLSGVVVFAYFAKVGCDPFANNDIMGYNQILPFYISSVLNYPPIPGVFVACVFCGSLSNLSSTLSSISALAWEDLLKQHFGSLSESRKAFFAKILAFSAGVLTIIAAFLASMVGGTLIKITITLGSVAFSPILIFVLCGALSAKPNYKCVYLGAMLTFVTVTWISLGNMFYGSQSVIKPTITTNCTVLASDDIGNLSNTSYNLITETLNETVTPKSIRTTEDASFIYNIPFFWYLPIGLTIGIVTTLLFSLFKPLQEESGSIDVKYLFPFMKYFYESVEEDESAKGYAARETLINGNEKKMIANESTNL